MWNSLRQSTITSVGIISRRRTNILLLGSRSTSTRCARTISGASGRNFSSSLLRNDNSCSSCSVVHHHHQRQRSFSSAAVTQMMLQPDDNDIDDNEIEKQKLRDAATREALDRKTGRLWSDPWDIEDMLNSKLTFEDLPEWSPKHVSRISQERVQIYSDKIPTLSDMASLNLPSPPPPHPGLGYSKSYALHRKRSQYAYILDQVKVLAQPRIQSIQKLEDWQDRQDAVDQLFEEIEFELKDKETVLGKHPKFGTWVERALEEYLRTVQQQQQEKDNDKKEQQQEGSDTATGGGEDTAAVDEVAAVPIFMDCYNPDTDAATAEEGAGEAGPKILYPLVSEKDPHKETEGRMVEEWELSAHKTSRRIMLRHCTKQIARIISEVSNNSNNNESQQRAVTPRILVCGRQGVGKTAALAAIVASARKSGSIVLYLPYGDQFHQNGFYIEPNARRNGIFDLPILSQQVCEQLLESHENDLADFEADQATLEKFFTADQLESLSEGESGGDGSGMKVVDLLKLGTKRTSFAAMCYAASIDVLMKQDKVPFLMVLDEFNCYYAPGHYFHAAYDEDVKEPIPYNEISLFKPAMDAMAISAETEEDLGGDDEAAVSSSVCMKRGAILVATTESHAVARNITDGLVSNVKKRQEALMNNTDGNSTSSMHLIEVPRLSILEVEHMLANYEATGVGKLRLDRGETVMNEQEVAYLRMVSGGTAQKLLDASLA